MIQGNVGPYKLAYLKSNSSVLYSRMFDRIELALDFGHKLTGRWLLFQKIGHDGDDYAWKLLPYGAYQSFKTGIVLDKGRIVIIVLAVILLIYVAKKIFSLKPKLPVY